MQQSTPCSSVKTTEKELISHYLMYLATSEKTVIFASELNNLKKTLQALYGKYSRF